MSVTVYVDGWADVDHTLVKNYMDQEYPNLDADDFEWEIKIGTHFLEEGTGRIYEMKREYSEKYPEINMANGNFAQVLSLLGMSHLDKACDSLTGERLDRFYQAILKAQNSKAKSASQDDFYREGNINSFVTGENYYTTRLDQLLNLIRFARQKGVGIYWA